jgi:hypothetical protein
MDSRVGAPAHDMTTEPVCLSTTTSSPASPIVFNRAARGGRNTASLARSVVPCGVRCSTPQAERAEEVWII